MKAFCPTGRSIADCPTTSLYYRDPDGNSIELQVDNFATKEEAARYFLSEAFRENPIGVSSIPKRWSRRMRPACPRASSIHRPVAAKT